MQWNVLDSPAGPALLPADQVILAGGAVIIDASSFDWLRLFMNTFEPHLTIHGDPSGVPAACVSLLEGSPEAEVCAKLTCKSGAIDLIDSLHYYLDPLGCGLFPPIPLAQPPEGSPADAIGELETSEAFGPLVTLYQNQPFTLEVAFDPDGVGVTHPAFGDDIFEPGSPYPVGSTLEPGIYFPAMLTFSSVPGSGVEGGPYAQFVCDCADVPASPVPLPSDGCQTLCTEQADFPACTGIALALHVNRLPMAMGFPGRQGDVVPNDAWTATFFPGAKSFHVADMWRPPFEVKGLAVGASYGLSFEDVALDTTADFAVGVHLAGCNAACGLVPGFCEVLGAAIGVQKLARLLPNQIGDAIAAELGPRFDYDEWSVPACRLDTCPDGPDCCDGAEIEELANASLSYLKWQWLASAFGPYPNGSWLPVGIVEGPSVDAADAGSARIRLKYLGDVDHDGIVNPLDPCWTDASQVDSDGDGIPDPCDPCKDDADNDLDHDGVCGGTGPDADNCPSVPNATQANNNEVSESFHTPDEIWGDPCDPVPTPSAVPQETQKTAVVPFATACVSTERNRLLMRPRRSYSNTDSSVSVPVYNVPTSGRFCRPDAPNGIFCDNSFAIDDERLLDAECAILDPSAPPPCADWELDSDRFHRVTLYYSTAGNPAETGGEPNAPLAKTLNYVYFAGAGNAGPIWRWDYRADAKRWVATSIFPDLETASNPVLVMNDLIGTDLEGTLWFHGDTPVGDTMVACNAQSECTGLHGSELANHHKLGFRVHDLECTPLQPFEWNPDPYLFIDQGDPPNWRRWDAFIGESSVLVRAGNDVGVLGSDGRLGLVPALLGQALRARLAEPGLRWANAVEPSADMGRGRSFPLAVALSPTGHDIVDSVRTGPGMLLADADRGVVGGARDGSPDATGFVPVLSRYLGGVFVVGGLRSSSTEPAGEIWYTPLDGTHWSEVSTAVRPEHVLAATYSFASDSLYVLDDTREGRRRLWAHELAGNRSRLIASFPRTEAWERHALSIDPDGAVLLSSSSAALDAHAVARFDARNADALTGIWRGTRPLLLPPQVDLDGTTFVLPARPGWPSEAVVGQESVWLEERARVTGDVAVANAAPGQCLFDRLEAAIGPHAVLDGSLRADDVRLFEGSTVTGSVGYNALTTDGTIGLPTTTPLALPLALTFPATPAFAPGAGAVIVGHGEERELEPGAYGVVRVKAGDADEPTSLTLVGGSYDFAELDVGAHASLSCTGRCEVRVAGRVKTAPHSYVGPAVGTDLDAADVVVIARGKNGGHGALGASPKAFQVGPEALVVARLFAPLGTLVFGERAVAKGTFVAREVRVGERARVDKDEGAAVRLRLSALPLRPAALSELAGQL